MRPLFLVPLVLALVSVGHAQGGMPGNCACSANPVYDTFPVFEQLIGGADSNAYCVVNTGGTTCRMVGTITLNFNPSTPYTLSSAVWGMPLTDISGSLGIAGQYLYDHPSSAYEYCDNPNQNYEAYSAISIQGTFGPNNTQALLFGIRAYACTTS